MSSPVTELSSESFLLVAGCRSITFVRLEGSIFGVKRKPKEECHQMLLPTILRLAVA